MLVYIKINPPPPLMAPPNASKWPVIFRKPAGPWKHSTHKLLGKKKKKTPPLIRHRERWEPGPMHSLLSGMGKTTSGWCWPTRRTRGLQRWKMASQRVRTGPRLSTPGHPRQEVLVQYNAWSRGGCFEKSTKYRLSSFYSFILLLVLLYSSCPPSFFLIFQPKEMLQ